ncbi:MAG: acetyl/propionyl/methylcrotonyl-CoA carboxylase subunit alpha, partial [Microvirga sp.]
AQACLDAGLVFIGPSPEAIRAMGNKAGAKDIMREAGVPVVPGYQGADQSDAVMLAEARKIGFPVMIKAVAGGGGRGMRLVEDAAAFPDALRSARSEAQGAFGDPTVILERGLVDPRHIEIQVVCDRHGNAIHLGERDCSVQRRHQKLIEEAPSPAVSPELRARMGEIAVNAVRSIGYEGAGTLEFLLDPSGEFYFMEMNTRLQVEHPVTEAITGLDLVELQFRVAAGETLPFGQDDLAIDGHAVEARLYAEDPEKGFLPSTGKLWALQFPAGEGVRIDTGVAEGDAVTPFYDPMIAKVIAHGASRDEALDRLSAALGATLVAGPKTNLGFLRALADAPEFRAGRFDTGFIDANLQALGAVEQPLDEEAARLGALMLIDDEWETLEARRSSLAPAEGFHSPWSERDGFELGPPRSHGLSVVVEGHRHDMSVTWAAEGPEVAFGSGVSRFIPAHFVDNHRSFPRTDSGLIVLRNGRQTRVDRHDPFAVDLEHIDEGGAVKAPMHGKLIAVFVKPGDKVEKGQRLAIVEAMKMEHALVAPAAGEVAEVAAEPGQQVAEGARLIVLATGNPAPR